MNKALCIFPKERTTSFLQPVFDMLQEMGVSGFNYNTIESNEDLYRIIQDQIKNSDLIIEFCHGCSTCLYGTQGEGGFDGNELLSGDDLLALKGKKLILFSCNSVEMARKNKYVSAVVFGLIPCTIEETQTAQFHNLSMKKLTKEDVNTIQQSLVRVWIRTLRQVGIANLRQFCKTFRFFLNVEIVRILIDCRTNHFRSIADVLFYIKKDMDYID